MHSWIPAELAFPSTDFDATEMIATEPIPFKPYRLADGTEKYQSRLPHWRQANATYFVTFRLADSIPADIHEQWQNEKAEWLSRRGVRLSPPISPEHIPHQFQSDFTREFNRKLNTYLDNCHGECHLRNSAMRHEVVQRMESVKCTIGSHVLMPNHVHVLITPGPNDLPVEASLKAIKGGSALAINRRLNRSGKLWQKDSFSHVVRTTRALERLQRYIESNPEKAGLRSSEYSLHQAKYDTT